MPHLGKPYPFPIHRDVMQWLGTPTHRMAKRYRLRYSMAPAAIGTCEIISRTQDSEPVEYLYNDIVCRWRWDQPCPSAWSFYLELIRNDKLEDFTWRWSSYQAGTRYGETNLLPMLNPPSNPHTENLGLWINKLPGFKGPLITIPPSPTPW